MRRYKHLFFDWDNTIWDLNANVQIGLEYLYENYSLNRFFTDFNQFQTLYQDNSNRLWQIYPKGLITRTQMNRERFLCPLQQVGVDDEQLADAMDEEFLQICASRKSLFPKIEETLTYLSAKYNLYLLTNGYSVTQQQKIDVSGLRNYFKRIFISDVVGFYKPDRRIFECALKSSNARKTESVMIGDNFQSDIEGARHFGIDQIYISADSDEDLPFLPTAKICNFAQLMNIL